ncbi:hypothetical protein ACFQ6C_26650 [Streptomyces sp. NPDC056454]|uniref:hypothetical protein n=1 Tax=Streptomyces sp. NPDC056454 TaxID=3345823 RepID=UPI0036744620
MTELCGAFHPERPAIVCDRPEHGGTGFHRSRADGVVWEAAALPSARRAGRQGLAALAVSARRAHRTGGAAAAVERWREERSR